MSKPNRFDWAWFMNAPLDDVKARVARLNEKNLRRWRRAISRHMKTLAVPDVRTWARCGYVLGLICDALRASRKKRDD
jgi:hypothetical protein